MPASGSWPVATNGRTMDNDKVGMMARDGISKSMEGNPGGFGERRNSQLQM